MKLKSKIITGLAVLSSAGALMAPVTNMTAMADTFSYTPIKGTAATSADAFKFDKDFVMSKWACIPSATFKYTITAGAGVKGSANNAVVYAGPAGATIADVVYTTNDQSAKVVVDGDEKTATKQATVDMSKCTFTEPGVYRYIITESGTNNGVRNDTELKRTLDVYVNDNGSSALEIAGYVLYQGVKTDAPSKTVTNVQGSKSKGYENNYDTYDLTFGKEVKGNFGSKDQYFEYTVKLPNVAQGTVLSVDISDADATPHPSDSTTKSTKANPTTLTAGASGITQKFYIHDGQYITIRDLPANAQYTVTEDNEDYTKTNGIEAADNDENVAHKDALNGTMKTDVKTGFTNTRDAVTPTGIFGPGMTAAIIGLGGGAVALGTFIAVKRKRASEE